MFRRIQTSYTHRKTKPVLEGVLSGLHQLMQLFESKQCLGCQHPSELRVCATCAERYQLSPTCLSAAQTGLLFPVFQSFVWNRRVRRLWYGVKFYKRYGACDVFAHAIEQTLRHILAQDDVPTPALQQAPPIWVVHPPFRAGKPPLFHPLLAPLPHRLRDTYDVYHMADALAWVAPEPEVSAWSGQKHRSRSHRFRAMAGAIQVTPAFTHRWEEAIRHGIFPRFILFDDIMTTGATLQACHHALQECYSCLVTNAQGLYDDKILLSPALQIQGLVLTQPPDTSPERLSVLPFE
jgi:predicted amidophosphoribosyltransferase